MTTSTGQPVTIEVIKPGAELPKVAGLPINDICDCDGQRAVVIVARVHPVKMAKRVRGMKTIPMCDACWEDFQRFEGLL